MASRHGCSPAGGIDSGASCRYAARVNNPRTYDAVSRDVLRRWTVPFVPDTNVLPRAGNSSFRMASHGVYRCFV